MLTREQILSMEVGRELDIRVIEDVLGAVKELNGAREVVWRGKYRYYFLDSFKPSTDISAAFEIEIEIMTMEGHIQIGYVSRLHEIVGVGFGKPLTVVEELKLIHATPEQRCKAALLAVLNLWEEDYHD